MNELIASLFSFQSTEPEQHVNEAEDEDDVMDGFGELEFNLDENGVLDNAIIYCRV